MSDTPLTDAETITLLHTGSGARGMGDIVGHNWYVKADFARQLERDRTRLLSALERLHLATCLILQSKPVRDMDEALSEATSAIAKAQVKP